MLAVTDGCIEQPAIAALGGGAACVSLFTSLFILFVLLKLHYGEVGNCVAACLPLKTST